jgi:hypothetical protein
MCQGGVRVSPGVIKLMNPGPYWPLYLWRGPARREGRVQRTAPCHTKGEFLATRWSPASLGTVR